ncbi:MAG: hypothetical protein QME28_02175 [Candidatus Saccharicenans sp.]|nr:hypothetical protein [Candidatus Saccharicenans sp.]
MENKACTNCGFVGRPKKYTRGSLVREIILWLLAVVPGIFYSVWRISTRYEGCPECGAPLMIPENSPIARKILGGD